MLPVYGDMRPVYLALDSLDADSFPQPVEGDSWKLETDNNVQHQCSSHKQFVLMFARYVTQMTIGGNIN